MTIDERLDFLLKSTQSLHAAVEQNTEHITQNTEHIGQLIARADEHEREMQRFRRAMRAALTAWLGDEPNGQNGGAQ
ncbi:MAG: hypothetical protein JO051_17520 [Acidobacteriaceae bacterium]|nr:hypothetical protein [Acidobacteriaceae bacterium]